MSVEAPPPKRKAIRRTAGGRAGLAPLAAPALWLAKARELLLACRENRAACRALGRNWRGADARWLAKAARARRLAAAARQAQRER